MIARLEAAGSNPTVVTLERVLEATGHELNLAATRKGPAVDETLIDAQLKLTPEERLRGSEAFNRWTRERMLAGARARGEDPA